MNIYDIAREAGVSISTVSRVLNNKNVTPENRRKIEAVMHKYDYKPNAVARGLVSKSMKTIGILSVDIRVPHYATTVYIMEQEFSRAGYNVIVCSTGGKMENNRKYIRNLIERQVDGILLVGSIFSQIQEEQGIMDVLSDVPVVLTNGRLSLPNSHAVMVNDEIGIGLSVGHLAEKGHRDIVYIKDLATDSAVRKKKGYLSAMRQRDLEKYITASDSAYGFDGGRSAAKELLAAGKTFSAVVCGEDLTAVGVIKGLTEAGLRVPEDVAVTGYNNSDYSRICTPELTTVDNKVQTFSLLSAQLLRNLIEGGGVGASMVVEPELVVRQSS